MKALKLTPKLKLAIGGILALLAYTLATRKSSAGVGISIAVDCDPSSVNYGSNACAGGTAYGGDIPITDPNQVY